MRAAKEMNDPICEEDARSNDSMSSWHPFITSLFPLFELQWIFETRGRSSGFSLVDSQHDSGTDFTDLRSVFVSKSVKFLIPQQIKEV